MTKVAPFFERETLKKMGVRMKINQREMGWKYEKIAADYLCEKGYDILERNVYTPMGEIDILAQKGGTLVFCEVKYRKDRIHGTPFAAVGWQKQRRICRSALYIYATRGYSMDQDCRFDVIGICGEGDQQNLQHIENAFDYHV